MAFKKGVSGNPDGSLPVGNDMKEARKLTRLEFERLVNKYLFKSVAEIQLMLKNQEQ